KGAPAHAHDPTVSEIFCLMFPEKHADGGDNQECAEEIKNKMKTYNQRHSKQDHDSAHDQRSEDSPHQSAMLCDRRDLEITKDQDEDEDVINAERTFDQVTGEKIDTVLRPFDAPDNHSES